MGIDFDFGWVISKQCVVGIMFRFMLWVYVCVCLFGMLLCHRQWTAALLRALVHLPAWWWQSPSCHHWLRQAYCSVVSGAAQPTAASSGGWKGAGWLGSHLTWCWLHTWLLLRTACEVLLTPASPQHPAVMRTTVWCHSRYSPVSPADLPHTPNSELRTHTCCTDWDYTGHMPNTLTIPKKIHRSLLIAVGPVLIYKDSLAPSWSTIDRFIVRTKIGLHLNLPQFCDFPVILRSFWFCRLNGCVIVFSRLHCWKIDGMLFVLLSHFQRL